MVLLGVDGRWSRLEEKPAKRSLLHCGFQRANCRENYFKKSQLSQRRFEKET